MPDIADAELSNRPVPDDSVQFMGMSTEEYWMNKSKKIRDLLGEQKFAVKENG